MAEKRKLLYWEGSSKKSKSGIATPQPDVELIERRLKAVLARYGAGRRS